MVLDGFGDLNDFLENKTNNYFSTKFLLFFLLDHEELLGVYIGKNLGSLDYLHTPVCSIKICLRSVKLTRTKKKLTQMCVLILLDIDMFRSIRSSIAVNATILSAICDTYDELSAEISFS